MNKKQLKKNMVIDSKQQESKNKKIEVHHLTRVEGHGDIVVYLDKNNQIQRCEWRVVEAPRFFEAMVVGRPYTDIHHIVSRICGICSIGHQLASIQATEEAFHCQVSEQTIILRKLALHAENLQSHLLHIGYLVLPDLLEVGSVFPLAKTHKQELLNIISCRKLSNKFSQVICGRTTHPQRLVPGGMESFPTVSELKELLKELKHSLAWLNNLGNLFLSLKEKYPKFERETEYIALVSNGEYALYHGEVGSSLDERKPNFFYTQMTNEYCVPQSTAKWTKNVKDAYMVGALARLNLNYELLTPGAKNLARRFGLSPLCHNPFFITLAQIVECVHSTEESIALLDVLLTRGLKDEKIVPIKPCAGKGVGALEAPRGILFHYYEYNEEGRIVKADCIIPTNQNHGNIQKDFEALAPILSGKSEREIEFTLSMLVRAYDPCISCSTHYIELGQNKNLSPVQFVYV
ncbi:MAG: Ni/Fe hydrogenase subunit alpha [Desulfonauticus sp.]|nr:Ni/Fe hydrogenase subunit alpha [Desulfonauticus sp.]